MEFPIARDGAVAAQTFVSEFAVNRLGRVLRGRFTYDEVVAELEDPSVLGDAQDADGDGVLETLVVPGWAGRTDLLGEGVYYQDGRLLGEILSWDDTTTTATLAPDPEVPIHAGLVGGGVAIERLGPFGSKLCTPAIKGRNWTTVISADSEAGTARAKEVLGGTHVEIVLATLVELVTQLGSDAALGAVTATEVIAAVEAMGERGLILTTFLAGAGQRVEMERRAGLVAGLEVTGGAPFMQ